MISKDVEIRIVLLFKNEKWPMSAIARELGIHRGVVSRVIKEQIKSGDVLPRAKLIDPYVPFIMETLKTFPEMKASRLFQMLAERGFQGRRDHFRTMLRRLRPEKKYEAFARLSVLEGEQGQVDWAHFGKIKVGDTERGLYAFVMVLSYSRQIFLKFYLSLETGLFMQGHMEAFAFFGGVPREILMDNLKSAVIERLDKQIRFNPRYLTFAAHYGFLPKPCNVRRGNEKGRVERAIRYIRENFYLGRTFISLEDLNKQAIEWCTQEAGQRKCLSDPFFTVTQAFAKEKTRLLSLPADAYPAHTLANVKVGKTHYARFDKNDYSVPGDYVRKSLTVQADADFVTFLHKNQLVARHTRSWGKGVCSLDPKHADDIQKDKARLFYSRNLENLFLLLPNTKSFLDKISEQGGGLGTAVQGLHACLGDYGIELVQEGIERAIQKPKVSITNLRIIVEKLQFEKTQKRPLLLSKRSEEKTLHLSIPKTDLSKYDSLKE